MTEQEKREAERERLEAERLERTADAVARRAKQIQEACHRVGVFEPLCVAAAIVADRIEDAQHELDYIGRQLDAIDRIGGGR